MANLDLITNMWDDLPRVAAFVQGGHATAALVVGKLCSSKRQQNALTSALEEYGALRRTVYSARHLVDETYRQRNARQLNKGENLHALRRFLAYAGEGALRRRHHEQQTEQMWCLTLATNAIVCWSTEYDALGVAALRRTGRDVDGEVLAHIWPVRLGDKLLPPEAVLPAVRQRVPRRSSRIAVPARRTPARAGGVRCCR
nr:transposase [Micromonospora sp. KC606]